MAVRHLPELHRVTGSSAVVEIRKVYRGKATLAEPNADDPAALVFDTVTCTHEHDSWEDAEKCGRQLGIRVARDRNKKTAPDLADVPCHVEAYISAYTPPRFGVWVKACRPHRSASPQVRSSRDEALALPWTCPWAELGTGPDPAA